MMKCVPDSNVSMPSNIEPINNTEINRWWMTGFTGITGYDTDDLSMRATIDFSRTEESRAMFDELSEHSYQEQKKMNEIKGNMTFDRERRIAIYTW